MKQVTNFQKAARSLRFARISGLMLTAFLILTAGAHAQYQTVGDGSSTATPPCGSGDCFELTGNTLHSSGAVWSNTKLDLRQPFRICFDAYFGNRDAGADGIAFVLHNDPRGTAALGGKGGFIGYSQTHPAGSDPGSTIAPSLAVEFDTWNNSAPTGGPGGVDIPEDHISIIRNGDVAHPENTVPADPHGGNIEDGHCKEICIEWDPTTDTLIVTFDGSERVRTRIDLSSEIFGGGTEATWGFTAATGAERNQQVVCIKSAEITPICCDDFEFLLNANVGKCFGSGTATFTGDPSACDTPFVALAGFDNVGVPGGVLTGNYALAVGELRQLTAYLISQNGDTICEESAFVGCDVTPGPGSICAGLWATAEVSPISPGDYDLFLRQSPAIPGDVYSVRVNGVVTASGGGLPLSIPSLWNPTGLAIGTVNPTVSGPTASIEYLDQFSTVICSESIPVGSGGGGFKTALTPETDAEETTDAWNVRVAPNPAGSRTLISFELPETAEVTIELFEISGRFVRQLHQGAYPAGAQQIELQTGDLPNGFYLMHLKTDRGSQTEQLLIQH